MIKKWVGLLAILCSVQVAFGQLSGTYTIGGNSPSYNTIKEAIDSLESQGVSGSVTFHIRQGTYTEQLTFKKIQGTDSTKTVTFKTEPSSSSHANITYSSGFTIKFTDTVSYVNFENLNIKTTGVANVIQLSGQNDHISFRNDSIVGDNGSGSTSISAVILDSTGKTTSNLLLDSNVILNGSSALYQIGGSYLSTNHDDGFTITNNSILGFNRQGLYLKYSKNVLVKGNYIYTNSSGNLVDGIYGDFNNHIDIIGNTVIVKSTSRVRPLFIGNLEASSTDRGLIANNSFSLLGSTFQNGHYVYLTSPKYYDIVFNNVYGESSNASGILYIGSTGTSTTFQNNCVYNKGTGAAMKISGTFSTMDYNNYYGNSGSTNLSGGTMGSNSITVDPKYISSSNLAPTNKALEGEGIAISGITTDINGNLRANPPTIGASQVASGPLSGTYTIGGTSPDYANFTLAIADLNSRGVGSAVIFNIRSGTYIEQIEIDSIKGSSASKTVTFQKEPGAASKPILTFASSSSSKPYTLKFDSCDYVTVKNLEIKATGTQAHALYFTGYTNYITVDSCLLQGKANVLGNQYMTVKFLDGASHQAKYCVIKNSTFQDGYYSLQLKGSTTKKGFGNQIVNNTMTNGFLRGIDAWYQDSLTIKGNVITTKATTSYSQSGIVSFYVGDNAVYARNKIEVNTSKNSFGLQFVGSNGSSGKTIKIINNSYINLRSPASSANDNGIQVSGNYFDIYNNSVWITSTDAVNSRGLQVLSGNNYNIKNNNFVNTGGGYAISTPALSTWTCDYNNFYVTGTNLGYYNNTNRSSFTNWKTATSKDANSQNLNPNFLADSLLKPNNGNLNNKGTTISGITKDIGGITRGSTPDIGAYEFTGVLPPMGGIYTIGGTSPDYTRIDSAVSALNSRGVNDTVVFSIRQGTYSEQIKIDSVSGSSASNWIKFTSDTANTTEPVITYAISGSTPYTLLLNSTSNIHFEKLKLVATNYSTGTVVLFEGKCEGLSFKSCKIEKSNSGYSFYSDWQGSISQTSDELDHLEISNCVITKAINLQGNSPTSDSAIFNGNIIKDGGISVRVFNYVLISDNNMNERISCSYSSNSTISGNKSGTINSYRSNNQKILNNSVVYDGGFGGIYFSGSSGNQVSFNSVKVTNASALGFDGSGVSSSSFKNNIFHSDRYSLQIDSNSNNTFDYNVYYSEKDTIAKYNSGSYVTSLNALKAAGRDSNSLLINPHFKNDSTLIPRIKELESAGTPIAGITKDIRDSLRSTTAPSIGAYEYTYVCDGLSGIYTIGGTSPDYATISAAVDDLNNLGICDDVTFNIRQGTYTGNYKLEKVYNSPDSGKIVFQADPSNTVEAILYDSLVQNANNTLFEIHEVSNIDFKKLNFEAKGNWATRILFINDSVRNLNIDSCVFDGLNEYSGLINAGSWSNEVFIDSIIITNTTFKNTRAGWQAGTAALSLIGNNHSSYPNYGNYTLVQNNEFDSCYKAMVLSRFNTIELSENQINNGTDGIEFLFTDTLSVLKNEIYVDNVGINLSKNGNYYSYINNIIFSESGSAISSGHTSGGRHDLFHNTLVSNSSSKPLIQYGNSSFGTASIDYNLTNNILYHANGGEIFRVEGNASKFKYSGNYNCLFTTGDTLMSSYDSSATSLMQFNSYFGVDSNSVSLDPYFTSDTLLIPYRASLDNKGTFIAQYNKDIIGSTRSLGNTDIGAYQFQGVNIDVAVHSVAVDTLCEGSQYLSAWVKNISDSTIKTAKMTAYAKVIGGAWDNLGTLQIVKDSLVKGDSIRVKSLKAYGFLSSPTYIIKIIVDTLNGYRDNDPTNNTSTDTVKANSNPIAVISSATACEGDSLKLNSSGGKYYEWFGVNSFTDTIQNPVRSGVTSAFAGSYTVIVRDTNYCIDSATTTVSIDTAPKPNLPSDTSICVGQNFTLSAIVDVNASYLWNIGETTPSITVDSAATYIVAMTNLIGCNGRDTFELKINSLPTVSIDSALDLICTNSASFGLDIANPKGGTYSGFLVSNDSIFTSSAGSYPLRYSYTDSNGCSNYIDTIAVVKSAPTVALTFINDLCINGGVDTITEHSPIGGKFYGSSAVDTNGYYNPKTNGVGLDSVVYKYTAANGCSDTAIQNIRVNDTLNIVLSTLNLCENSGTILLNQAATADAAGLIGNYSGSSALAGNYYNPSVLSGKDTLYYSVTDTNQCVSHGSRVIILDTIPIVTFKDTAYCVNADTLSLIASPSGGKFWGRGVLSNSLKFDPILAGVGLDTLTYAYTLPSNGCSDTVSNLTIINNAPTVGFTLPDTVVKRCMDAVPVILSGYSPLGGVFSGNGLDTTKTKFLANKAGVGSHVITYTYTASNGCSASREDTVTVFGLPVVSLSIPSNYCVNASKDTLKGGLPSGGYYSGNGVDTNGVFFPQIAGVSNSHIISYSISDSNSCGNVAYDTLAVDSLTPITLGLIPDYCINVGLDTLLQGSINSGNFKYTGRGILNGNEFDPIKSGLGKDTIWYVFTNAKNCSDSLTQTINVHDTSAVSLTIPSSLQSVCKNEAAFTLSFGTPSGGSYNSLPAIVGHNFNPSLASVGSHVLVYTYSNSNSCVTSAIDSIQVDSVPVVNITGSTFCLNDGNQTLNTASPSGGRFTGPGMLNDSIFSPPLAGKGISIIRYTFTVSATGCSNYADTSFIVNPVPSVSFSSLGKACVNRQAYQLNAGATNGSRSYYLGAGITDSTNGTFNPSNAGVGNHLISFVGENSFGCTIIANQNIRVDSVPIVRLDSISDLCIDAPIFTLNTGSPATGGYGNYFGKGVNGKFYYPQITGIGTDTLIYRFTDYNGCSSSDTELVVVNGLPNVSLASFNSLCFKSDSIVLTGGTPTGGLYSGIYVDSASQKFSPDSVGVFQINYQYTDSNKCTNNSTSAMQVRALPNVRLSFASSLCKNISPFILSGGTPIGATGKYMGNGVVGNFYTPDSTRGASDTLWYAFTDNYNCTDSVAQVIQLDSATPVVNRLLPELCDGAPDLNLAPYYTPAGGNFKGPGIFGNTLFTNILADGSYPIVYSFTDSNNCISQSTDTVYIRPKPKLVLSKNSAICEGESVGLVASGGVSYIWNTGDKTDKITQSPDSTHLYSVTVTNQYSCIEEGSVLVTVYENFSIYTSSSPSACSKATGTGYITINRGKAPFQYLWSDGERNSTNQNLVAGSYTVTVNDANSCEQYATVDVNDEGAPKVTLDSLRDNHCANELDGYIKISLNTTNPKVIWSNGMKMAEISGLATGVYSVRITDTSGCASAQSFEIKSPEEISLSSITTSPDCDSTNGSIFIEVKGGIPSYTYNWLGQSSSIDTLKNIGAGNYSLVIGDRNLCSDTFDFALNNHNAPLYRVDSILDVSCGASDGGIFITAFDTVQSYKWSSGPLTQNLSGISTGRYFVTITDTAGCKTSDAFNVYAKKLNRISLCYVTYDSSSTFNQIVWDTTNTSRISGYSVLRESAVKGKYFELARIPKGANPEFIDSSLNSGFNVGTYAIKTYDNCNSTSEASPIHKSLLLSTNKINNKIIQLNWSSYEGLPVNGFYIFRYTTSEGFKLLDSTSANIRSYNDFNVLEDEKSLFYFVMVRSSGPCTPSGSVISNYSTDFGTGVFIGIEEVIKELSYSVYPNPNAGEFYINFNKNFNEPVLLRLYDVSGKIIVEKTLEDVVSNEPYALKLLDVSNGLYYVQVVSNGKVNTTQIVINR